VHAHARGAFVMLVVLGGPLKEFEVDFGIREAVFGIRVLGVDEDGGEECDCEEFAVHCVKSF